MFRFPFGTTQELNLDWFLEQWEIFKQEAQTALGGIDHALDAEIQRVEDAMTDLYAARDSAVAAKNNALDYAQSANSSAIGASQSAQNSAASAVTSAQQAQSAAQSAISAQSSATNAGTSAGNALTQAQQSEAWATGEIGGVHVPPSAPQNQSNSKQYATNAQLSANAANSAKNDARVYSQDSKAWATGIRNGEPVTSEDETYQNNAKYYAESISGDAAAAAQSASDAAASAASVGQSAAQIAQNASDIEDLKSATTQNEERLFALDGIVAIKKSDWDLGTIYQVTGSPWAYYWSNKRARTKENFYYTLPKGTRFKLSSYNGYRFGCGYRVGETYYGTGWLHEDFVLPFDADVTIAISQDPEVVEESADALVSMLSIDTTPTTTAFYYQGEKIDISSPHYYNWISYNAGAVPTPEYINTTYGKNVTAAQSFAHYGDYFVVGYSNDVLVLLDNNYNIISVLDAESGHANAISFSNEFYDSNDILPLLYLINTSAVSSANSTLKILRISNTTTITTLNSITLTGLNYPIVSINPDTNLLYILSYSQPATHVSTDNTMQLTECVINGNSVETLRTVDMGVFIPVIQDATIVNNLMFVVSSGHANNIDSTIWVIDTKALSCRNILTMFDHYYQSVNEPEGITVKDNMVYTFAGTGIRYMKFID